MEQQNTEASVPTAPLRAGRDRLADQSHGYEGHGSIMRRETGVGLRIVCSTRSFGVGVMGSPFNSARIVSERHVLAREPYHSEWKMSLAAIHKIGRRVNTQVRYGRTAMQPCS